MNKLPIRKQIRLKNYDYSQNGYYFVTICTYNRQKLFVPSVIGEDLHVITSQVKQNNMIGKWLLKSEDQFNITITYFVIMEDHIHFILAIDKSTKENNLSEMIQWFKTMTTNEYISLVKAELLPPFDKKIWQRSYYEHIIRDEEDYIATIKYIVENPIKKQLL